MKQIVIVGCGFGGLTLAKKLRKLKVKITLVDKNNYHTFQPLLYQVATGGLEAENIAIIGGGPAGLEIAGAIAEMKKYVLLRSTPGGCRCWLQ
jgi:NADH dehydrogenase FAD-containing subunit